MAMRRRTFIAALGGAVAWPLVALGQQDRLRRVVVLMTSAESDPLQQVRAAILRDGLSKLGWIDGRNIQFGFRWQGTSAERAKTYVAEIVANPPDIVVAASLEGLLAMRREANAVATVFVNMPDPVAMGLVSDLAKPDANFTGFTAYEFAIAGKWFETLKELAPQVTRFGMILGNNPGSENFYRSLQIAASGVETTAIRIDGSADVAPGIESFALKPNGGLLMAADAFGFANRVAIIDLAARFDLPAVYPFRDMVAAGGLAFYGIDFLDLWRGAATYVDRILRGTKPADLPIQAPTKFQLALNLKTAKALGLQIPPSLLVRADEVIE
jgi:putative tryptophan/tyrosine transport system substrate-binding protein